MKNITLKIILTLGAIAASMPIGATGAPGDLYVSDNNRIWKFSKTGTATVFADLSSSTAGTNFPRIRGLAFDSAGNLYASTLDTSTQFDDQARILKFASNGTFSTFATGFTLPQGMAFDRTGNLLVAGAAGTVYKITPTGTVSTVTTIGPGDINNPYFVQVFGIVFDKAGNLYVEGVDTIFRITDCGAVFFAFGFVNFPSGFAGLAFDSLGNLYASTAGDPSSGGITEFAPDGATQSSFADLSALDTDLRGLAFDSKDNLFVAGHGTNSVYEITSKGVTITFANAATMPAPGFNVPQFLAFNPK